ncbi:MAG TPA: hypothetical protein VG028_17910 [Terriglobia bacterium]|nr:hypothetical protein [Terriglobia bacterium]
MRIAIVFQIAALAVAGLALIWGIFAALSTFSEPGGDWSGLGLLGGLVVNVPIGLLTLATALIVRKGSRRLRRICIATSLAALFIPIIAILIWNPMERRFIWMK